MTRLLLATAIVAALCGPALAEDLYVGYVCEVRLVTLDASVGDPDPAGFGRIHFHVNPNADCSGEAAWLSVCSTDPSVGTVCAGGQRFTRPEMQAAFGALTNALANGMRAAAYTSTGRTAITILHIRR